MTDIVAFSGASHPIVSRDAWLEARRALLAEPHHTLMGWIKRHDEYAAAAAQGYRR